MADHHLHEDRVERLGGLEHRHVGHGLRLQRLLLSSVGVSCTYCFMSGAGEPSVRKSLRMDIEPWRAGVEWRSVVAAVVDAIAGEDRVLGVDRTRRSFAADRCAGVVA